MVKYEALSATLTQLLRKQNTNNSYPLQSIYIVKEGANPISLMLDSCCEVKKEN